MVYNVYADQTEQVSGLSLVSCGHIFANKGREIYRPHGREDWLLFFVASGSETFYFSKEVTAGAGSFVLFAPHEKQHHICQSETTSEFYYVHFKGETDLPLETSKVYTAPSGQAVELFSSILEETLKKQPCYERICLHRLFELMALIERAAIHSDHPQGSYFERIALAVQQMNRNYAQDITLSEYAEMCSMSKYHFVRVFRQVTGASPLEYRNRIRLEHAKELLEEGRMSVSEVGETVGFSSPAYFSDAFKRKMGCSPSEYRRAKTR